MTVLPKLTIQKEHQRMAFAEWAQNKEVIHEKVHHAPRITVWVAISSHGLLGPIFFEETVNSEHHLSMLHNTSVPHLLVTGLLLKTPWFMQDGARLHTANVFNFLLDTFNTHVMSNRFPDHSAYGQNWPPNSPDVNPCDYFISVFLKENIKKKTQIVMELRAQIIQACNKITEDMCRPESTPQFALKKLPDIMMLILNTFNSKRINHDAMVLLFVCRLSRK
jgi:hypothetical protein